MTYEDVERTFERVWKKLRRRAFKQWKAGFITEEKYRRIMRNIRYMEDAI